MKPTFLILAVFFSFSACSSNHGTLQDPTTTPAEITQNGTKTEVKTIQSPEAKALLAKQENVVILDVRTPEEYAAGHLQTAKLINKYDPDFAEQINALDRNKTYLIYCKAGGRSAETTKMMTELGFKNIYDATEGFESLKNAGVPAE